MIEQITFLFFSILILIGGNEEPSNEIKIVNQDEFIKLGDTVAIAINEQQLGQYPIMHISDDNLLSDYNKLLHRIDVFDLESRAFSHSVTLNKKGPNGIISVLSLMKIEDDYLIKNGHYFSIVSKEGVIISKKSVNDLEISKEGYTLKVRGTEILDFHKTSVKFLNESFLHPIYKYREDGKIDLSSNFISSINFTDWTSSIIPIS